MQVLKDDLRQSMLGIAKHMFLELGFEKTSMKDIAQKVGISVGNLYRYFPNKEALFDAVTMPAYDQLLLLFRDPEPVHPPGLTSMMDVISLTLSSFLQEHRESLLILLFGSKGTHHEQAKEQLVEHVAEHVSLHISDYNRKNPSEPLQPQVSRPVATAFLEGYFDIIRRYSDEKQIRQISEQYFAIWFRGLEKLI